MSYLTGAGNDAVFVFILVHLLERMLAVVQFTLHKSTADAKTQSESKVLYKGISLRNLRRRESYVVELVDRAEMSVLPAVASRY